MRLAVDLMAEPVEELNTLFHSQCLGPKQLSHPIGAEVNRIENQGQLDNTGSALCKPCLR